MLKWPEFRNASVIIYSEKGLKDYINVTPTFALISMI